MKLKRYLTCLLFMLPVLMGGAGILIAQNDQATALEIKPEDWKKATEGLDYSGDREKPLKQKENNLPSTNLPQVSPNFFSSLQGIAIILCVLLIGVGLYFVLRNPRNREVKPAYDIEIEQLEERLQETDLMKYLRQALAQEDYPVAIRLYFLQMLKDLNSSGHIKWSKEKTNRMYMLELTAHPEYRQIAENSRMYETIWYGKTQLTKERFLAIEPAFRDLLMRTGTSLQYTN